MRLISDGGEDFTSIQQQAADELDDVEDRMNEIRGQINLSEVWDPSVDSTQEEKNLAEEYDRLVTKKMALEKIIEEGLP